MLVCANTRLFVLTVFSISAPNAGLFDKIRQKMSRIFKWSDAEVFIPQFSAVDLTFTRTQTKKSNKRVVFVNDDVSSRVLIVF